MRITYETITPIEGTEGEYAEERGYVEPSLQMKVPVGEINDEDWPAASLEWTLTEAERYLGRYGMEDSGNWFTALDPDRNYQTGAETTESLHPSDNITGASYERLARIFCWDRDPRRKSA